MGKLKSLYLVLLVLLHVLRVVRHYLQLVRDLELVRMLYFDLLHLLARVPHRPQSVEFDYLLRVVLLVFDQIPLIHYFFNDARVELSISRIDRLAMSSLLEKFFIWFFQHFEKVSL
jgi:hypothetical protein